MKIAKKGNAGRPPVPKPTAKIRDAKRLFKAGHTIKVVGAMLGISATQAFRFITHGEGPTGRRRGPVKDEARHRKAKMLRGLGWSYAEIGAEMGVGIQRARIMVIL